MPMPTARFRGRTMGTASVVGLLTAPLSLARLPLRLTLRVWEFGLSSAAEAARLGMELLGPERPPDDFARHRAPAHPAYEGNGSPPASEAAVAEPAVDDFLDVEPPAPPDARPAVP